MIIAISGTPGTGKTEAGKLLVEKLNQEEGCEKWRIIELNKMAEQKKLYSGYDKKRDCQIVDTDALSREIGRVGDQDMVVESHYAHDMPADLIIILRTNPDVLRQRLRERGWKTKKIEENVLSEIMEVCKSEALETGKQIFELDTSKKGAEETAEEMLSIVRLAPPRVSRDLKLPAEMRPEFKRPFGELVEGEPGKCIKKALKKAGAGTLVSVGDAVTYHIIASKVKPVMAVIDGKESRKPFEKDIKLECSGIMVKNPAGTISKELWETVKKFSGYGKGVKIFVEGEEDLAVLPCAILMPENTVILYGLADRGVVVLKLTREKKGEAIRLLKRIMELQ